MAKRRRQNQSRVTAGTWAAAAGVAAAIGGVTYLIVRYALPTPKEPTKSPPDLRPSPAPAPTPAPKPTPPAPGPKPRPNLCDPTDPLSWPAGKLCIHDGERFILVDADDEPEELPSYETSCSIEVEDDHMYTPAGGRPHTGLSGSQGSKLASLVALDKNGGSVRLMDGHRIQDWFDHDHAVILNAQQIDALRSGNAVYTTSSYDNDHSHPVVVSCETHET